jgi:hypothetical protein
VGLVSEKDRKIFEQLVSDCILFGLNECESLEYIQKRSGGVTIARSTFYLIKKRISQQESNLFQQRMNEHIRVGFALSHFRYIHSLEYLQKILFKTIAEESSKPSNKINLFGLSRLATNILMNVQFLRQLNIDTPFINQMKTEVNKAKEYERLAEQKINFDSSDAPESALVFDAAKFFGSPPEALSKQNSGMDDTPVVE